MQQELIDLCSRKCVPKDDIKCSEQLSLPQRSCFHRCTIKYLEALRFTQDMLKFQNYEIQRNNDPLTDPPQASLM